MFWKKVFEKQRAKAWSFPKHPLQPSERATNFENNPYRPSERATNFENSPCRPSEWASNFENNPRRPSEWATNFKNSPYRPSEWATFSENTLADPPNGHRILKTSLTDGSEAGFSRKTTKTIPTFRFRFIPARHTTKGRLPGTRSTAACLYIDDPSAFNPTISHSRSPADGADWCSWDTCAHSS